MKHEAMVHERMMPRLFGSLRGAFAIPRMAVGEVSQLPTEEINIDEAKARINMTRAEAAQIQSRLTFA